MVSHRTLQRVLAYGLAVLLAAVPGLASAQSYSASPVIPVSGLSPFTPGCAGVQPGTNYLSSEVEPWVAANPLNPNNFVEGWQQDRWSDGGATSLSAGATNDGGATWHTVVIPEITLCAGGSDLTGYQRATDPWVTFSPDGHAYFFTLAFNAVDATNGLMVSKSTDGGFT